MLKQFSNFFGDNILSSLEQDIEDIVKSAPVKDAADKTSTSDSSNLLHQFLMDEDSFKNKESLKKNPFHMENNENNGIMSEVKTLLDKLSIQTDRASRYQVYEGATRSMVKSYCIN